MTQGSGRIEGVYYRMYPLTVLRQSALLSEQNHSHQAKTGLQPILCLACVPVPAGNYQARSVMPAAMALRPFVASSQGAAGHGLASLLISQGAGYPSPGAGSPPQGAGSLSSPEGEPRKKPPVARVLIEIDGKVVGQRVLDKPALTIGRLSSNDIPVPSQRVSRLHAKIRAVGDAWIIEDAESLNGLVYQGQRIDHLTLSNGDRVYVSPGASLHYQTA